MPVMSPTICPRGCTAARCPEGPDPITATSHSKSVIRWFPATATGRILRAADTNSRIRLRSVSSPPPCAAFCFTMPVMKIPTLLMGSLIALPLAAHSAGTTEAGGGERLGTVSFPVSCSPSLRAQFVRGVALLHDFWYQEAQRQFEQVARRDPDCSMAHWGIAMSVFHQIWDRPNEAATATGRREMQVAREHPAKTARERAYVAALGGFFLADTGDYQSHIDAYAAAMGRLYQDYPGDTDAGAFYALALLAASAQNDTRLTQGHKALAVLNHLFAKFPDHPGVVHYIIHACDTPSLAPDGLAAARHYGEIAPSGPHAVHMPGHIFARLGLWQDDIDSNAASVAASAAAETHHQNGAMDQFH